jgi:hypothetical protein
VKTHSQFDVNNNNNNNNNKNMAIIMLAHIQKRFIIVMQQLCKDISAAKKSF